MKQNNKGFMMSELLAATVVILIIFGFVYVNFLPTTSEYKKKTTYQDLNATYDIYYFKKIYREVFTTPDSIKLNSNNYLTLYSNDQCQGIPQTELSTICNNFGKNANIDEVILAKYDLSDIKYSNNNMKSYINYLKDSEKSSSSLYRLILKTKNNTYATTELFKDILTYDLKIINKAGGTLKYTNINTPKEELITADTVRTMTNILKQDKILLEATPEPGYSKVKITLNGVELEETSFIYDYSNNSVLVAEYIPNEHQITINNSSGGALKITNLNRNEVLEINENQNITANFSYNDEIKLEAISNNKYRIDKVLLNNEPIDNNNIQLKYDEDIILNVTWKEEAYKISKLETLATFEIPSSAYYNDDITITNIQVTDDNLVFKGAIIKDMKDNILLTINDQNTFKMPSSDIKVELLFSCKDKDNCPYTSSDNVLN